MPGRHSSITREDGRALLVRRKVVHTYSRVCPRQLLDRHHFLTPDTPVLEELELPSHLLRESDGYGSGGISGSLSLLPPSAGRPNNGSRFTSNPSTGAEHNLAIAAVASLAGESNVSLTRDLSTNQQSGNNSEVHTSPSKRRRLEQSLPTVPADSTAKAVSSPGRRRRGRKTTTAQKRRQRPKRANSKEKQTRAVSKEQLGDENGAVLVEQQYGDAPQIPNPIIHVDPVMSPSKVATSSDPPSGATIGSSNYTASNLDPVSMEMTCEATVHGRVATCSDMQPVTTLSISQENDSLSQHCDQSTGKKVKFFIETIAAEMGNKISSSLEEHSTVLKAPETDVQDRSNSSSMQKEYRDSTVCSPAYSQNSPQHLKEQTDSSSSVCDEESIELPRTRDPHEEYAEVTGLDFRKSPSHFDLSKSEHMDSVYSCRQEEHMTVECNRPRQKGRRVKEARHNVSVDLAGLCGRTDALLRKKLRRKESTGSSSASGEGQTAHSKDFSSTKSCRSAVSNNSGSKMKSAELSGSGRDSTSCSILQDHFSGLQMTPIAPLTSTPVEASSGYTPKNTQVGELLNFECTPDLNPHSNNRNTPLPTPFPRTSTPIYPPPPTSTSCAPPHRSPALSAVKAAVTSAPPHSSPAVTRAPGNTRQGRGKGSQPAGSWVDSTMERLLDFDEIGFQASEELDFTAQPQSTKTPQPPQVPSQNSFGFTNFFGRNSDNSQQQQAASKDRVSYSHCYHQHPDSSNGYKSLCRTAQPARDRQHTATERSCTAQAAVTAQRQDKTSKDGYSQISSASITGFHPPKNTRMSSRRYSKIIRKALRIRSGKKRRQSHIIPKSLYKSHRTRKHKAIESHSTDSSTLLTGPSDSGSTSATNPANPNIGIEDYPLCILVQSSHKSKQTYPRYLSTSYKDISESFPSDILSES